MNRCFSCRYWVAPSILDRPANYNRFAGRCTNPRLKQPLDSKDAASVEGDGYHGTLWTAPEFGCVHYEAP